MHAIVYNCMDGKLIQFPKVARNSNVIQFRGVQEQARVIDLAEQGRRIRAMQKEIRKIKAGLLLRLVQNGNEKG